MKGSTNVKDRFSKFFNPNAPDLSIYTVDDYNDVMSLYDVAGTNWQDRIFGNIGTTQNHSISLMGGGKTSNFNLSYNNVRDNAIMMASDYKQDNLNFKLSAKPIKVLKVDLSSRFSDTKVSGSGGNDVTSSEKSTSDSRLRHSVIYTPVPLRNYADDAEVDEEEVGNLYPPDEVIFDNWKQTRKINYSFNGSISATLTKGLVLRTEAGINNTKSDTERYYGPTSYFSRTYSAARSENTNAYQKMGIVTIQNANSYRFRNANTLSYDKKNINKSHHSFNLMLGEETVVTRSDVLFTEVAGLPDYLNYADAMAFTVTGEYPGQIDNTYAPDDKLLSFFGRFNYDYKGIYLFTATMRADGSSMFARGNRWGYFPSVAVAWRFSDEDFMKEYSYWISNLKPRLSIGSVGNNKIASRQYMIDYQARSAQGYIPYYSDLIFTAGDLLPNPDLKWETTITRNLGLDFGFFKHRLNGNFDLYYNNTKDLLLLLELQGSGYSGQYKNIGSTENKGFELFLNGIVVDKKKFAFDVSANISINRGKVVALDGRDEFFESSKWGGSTLGNNKDYIIRVGEPVGQMYGYVTEGRYAADDFKWDGVKWVMNDDKYAVADVAPDETTPIYKDAEGNVFVDNSGLTRKSWGPGALKLKDLDGDVLMPEMDGLQLLDTIKLDRRTSHIPVILLTAVTDMESKIAGLKIGADDYITKPFSAAFLHARIENLMNQRSLLQQYYRYQMLSPKPDFSLPPLEISSQEEIFMKKMMKLMEENLDNYDLNIDYLASEIGMSRTVFYNKLKSLTGFSPVEFVREIRFQRAGEYVKNTQCSISEISYRVGFNDPRYFSRSFKQHFGMTPSEYRQQYAIISEQKQI